MDNDEIVEIKKDIKDIRKDLTDMKVSIATMKVKIGYFAGGFSFLGAIVVAIVKDFLLK